MSVKSLLADGVAGLGKVKEAVQRAPDKIIPEREVTLLPPIPDPAMFFCVGKNYQDHLEELVRTNLIKEIPDEPTGFLKLNSVLVGQDAEVARPQGIVQFDYEPELAFVIGKPGYRISKERAMDHVIAITAFNDLTAREIQKKEAKTGTKFWTAKNMPGFGPVGPYIVTIDEIKDIDDLWLNCSVNGGGDAFQYARSNLQGAGHHRAFFPVYAAAHRRRVCDRSAGGVAVGQANAAELFLKPGDNVTMEIEPFLSLRTGSSKCPTSPTINRRQRARSH